VPFRQRDDQIAMDRGTCAGQHQKPAVRLAHDRRNHALNVGGIAHDMVG
jgi:hypothetical protein